MLATQHSTDAKKGRSESRLSRVRASFGRNAAVDGDAAVDGTRSAYEQVDWHEQEEQRFLVKLVERLDAAVNAGEAKSLIVAAPPQALGIIREASSKSLRSAVRAEIEKDFVGTPLPEIEKHFTWPM